MKNIILGFFLFLISPYVLAASDDWTGKQLKCEKRNMETITNKYATNPKPKEEIEEIGSTEFYQFYNNSQFRRYAIYYIERDGRSTDLDIEEGTYAPTPNMPGYMNFVLSGTFKGIEFSMDGNSDADIVGEYNYARGRLYFDRQKLLLKEKTTDLDHHIYARKCTLLLGGEDEFLDEYDIAIEKMYFIKDKKIQKIMDEKNKNKM